MSRPTIRDVARLAGVATGTVSAALNKPDLVAAPTRERIQAAIAQLGYVRDPSARQLRGRRSLAVGLVVIETNAFTTEIARGVEDAVKPDGYVVISCSSASSPEQELANLDLLDSHRVAGILMIPVAPAALARLDELRSHGTATVLISSPTERADQCGVWVDDVAGGRLAGEHLIALGHRRIGLINHHRSIPTAADRRSGFLRSLTDGGLTLAAADDVEVPAPTVAHGEEAAARLLDRDDHPSAVFCGNDLLAIGVLRAALTRGLSIPEDLAIVGYDDVVFAELATVPLTSIRQPGHQLGFQAARLLLDEARNAGDHRHEHVVFEPELVVRASTAGAAAAAAMPTRGAAAGV